MTVPSLRPALLFAALLALAVGGCATIPDLDSSVPDSLVNAPYPDLVPLDRLLASQPRARADNETAGSDLAARRDRLQQRARRLNTAVIDADTQTRMQAGVNP